MTLLLIEKPAILDGGWIVEMSYISHNMHNQYKLDEKQIKILKICWTTHGHVAAVKIWTHFDL